MTHFVGRNAGHPAGWNLDLSEGDSLHGLSDGKWAMIDAIDVMLGKLGPSRLDIATWTAAGGSIERAKRLVTDGRVLDCRFIVDRSFAARKPVYCALLRERFGDDSIRVLSAHCKFVVFRGGKHDAVYLTSANLGQNPRIENWSIFWGGEMPSAYGAMVDDVFGVQPPSVGFQRGSVARETAAAVFQQDHEAGEADEVAALLSASELT